jgi:hypothetical protein
MPFRNVLIDHKVDLEFIKKLSIEGFGDFVKGFVDPKTQKK